MGQHWECMLGHFFLILCVIFSHLASVTKGHDGERIKNKKVSFFSRHYDCLVMLYNEGHKLNSSLNYEGQHLDNITAQFFAFGRLFVVDLHLNKQLFSSSYTEKVFHSHGQSSETRHILHEADNCYYHGKLRFYPESEAALSTCDGLRGYITDRQDTYHIEPFNGNVHRVYRNRDQRRLPFKCGTESHDFRLHSHESVIRRHKRSIQAPYDSNRNTRYVELYLVNDFRTYERHGKMANVVIKRSQDIANIVSSLYRQLNIYVVLVGVEVWAGGDLVSITTNADGTMENFLRYRKERINPFHHNDNAQLITGVFFDHGVVGKAIKGPICTHQFSGGVNMDYGGLVNLVATTVAHEMGHNFGMEHDNDTVCECRDDKCIMAATSGQISPKRWSSCSQNALAEAFDLGMDYCLHNLPSSTYKGPICGNGYKEEGEECDCGLVQDCTNRCCNASSCTLHPLAKCGTGRCCDLDTCKPKPASTLCREPVSECDLAEFCDGTAEYCPVDVYIQNGQECKGGQSYCYNGQCRTQTDQCKLLWGETGRVSDPICFQQLNMNGNSDGNCGYNWTTDRYKRCDRENVMCGLLHCVHLNEKLMFWRDNLAIDMRASFLSRGNKQYVCRSAMLDVGLDMPDPGFIPDGAKCEEDKICINQQCVALAKLKIEQCSNNCDGHGVCNSKGNCHCNIGYAPPACDRPGFGGSIDSGPASDEYAKKDLLIALLVVFLLVIPLIVLGVIAFLNRHRLLKWWKLLPSFKYRVRGKARKASSPPQPPPPKPTKGQARKDFSPPSHQEGLTSNHVLHISDVHAKPKIWDSGNSRVRSPAPVAPPERPAAPRRPPSLFKSNSSAENKSMAKKVRLSIPIQETEGPPSPSSKQRSEQFVTSMTSKQESAKNIPQSPKSNAIVKRESFRGSEISDPILVCTTNRNSLVLADGKVDIIGPEAKMVSRSPPANRSGAVTVKRSQSERPMSRQDPLRPACVPPPPASSTLKKSESARSPNRVHSPASLVTAGTDSSKANLSGFRSRPVPPVPTYEEDDTQPVYTNESSDMNDLLSAIQGALKDSCNLYTNLSASDIHGPIQETAPPAPPRPAVPSKGGNTALTITGNLADARAKGESFRNTSEQRPIESSLISKKALSNASSNTKGSASISGDKQNVISKTGLANSANAPAINLTDTKPAVIHAKPSLASENSLKLKGAVSDELRNKILSRSDSSAKSSANSSQLETVKTPSVSATPPQKTNLAFNSSTGTDKPLSAKASSTDHQKPVTRSSSLTGSKQATARIISPNPDTAQASPVDTSNKPGQLKTKSVVGGALSGNAMPSSLSEAKNKGSITSDTARSSTAAKVHSRSATRDKTSETKPAVGPSSNVSNLAAKFTQSKDGPGKPTLVKTPSLPSEATGKKPVIRKTSQAEKPTPSGKPQVTLSRPDISEAPSANSSRSVTNSSRPNLPPKPGEPGGTTPAPSNTQIKRVQSYRI